MRIERFQKLKFRQKIAETYFQRVHLSYNFNADNGICWIEVAVKYWSEGIKIQKNPLNIHCLFI